jgi:hypothetical protein
MDKHLNASRFLPHLSGVHMLAIGVGSGVDDNELNAIASDPDSQNVFKAATFDSLSALQNLLAAKACERKYLAHIFTPI